MTDATTTHDRDTITRAGQLFTADGALHWDDAVAQAATLLEEERAEEAERQAKSRERVASFTSMQTCPVEGCAATITRTGLCLDCSQHEADIRAERSRQRPLPDGGDRRAAVEAWLERLGR